MSLLLCRREPVERPYYIDVLGIHVFSSQELCYVIFNHPLLVMEEFLNPDLLNFIRTQLDMEFVAGRMEKLVQSGCRAEEVLSLFLSESAFRGRIHAHPYAFPPIASADTPLSIRQRNRQLRPPHTRSVTDAPQGCFRSR